jgi:hypothetical protein
MEVRSNRDWNEGVTEGRKSKIEMRRRPPKGGRYETNFNGPRRGLRNYSTHHAE